MQNKFDISKLKMAKDASLKNMQKRVDESSNSFNEAVELLQKFQNDPSSSPESLKIAASKLVDSLKRKSNNPDGFVLVAYIFYMLNDDKSALKYLKLAKMLDPDAKSVQIFQDFISNTPITQTPIKRVTGPLSQTSVTSGETKISQSNTPVREGPISSPKPIQRINKLK